MKYTYSFSTLFLYLISSFWAKTGYALCNRGDEGDCFLLIRAGEKDNEELARGIKFIRDHDQESFGYIAAVPNEDIGSAEMSFALGHNEEVHARLQASGLFAVSKILVDKNFKENIIRDIGNYTLDVVGNVRIKDGILNTDAIQVGSKDEKGKSGKQGDARIELNGESSVIGLSSRNGMVEEKWDIRNGKGISNDDSNDITGELQFIAKSNENGDKSVLRLSNTAPSDSVVVSEEGYVGLGTRWPSVKLDVNGGVQGTAGYSSASDRRYKKNIKKITGVGSLEQINALQGVTYEWKRKEYPDKNFASGRNIPGFIAQEVEQTLPELVTTNSDGYKSLSYSGIIPILVEAVKELQKQNERLKQEVEQLKELRGGLLS